MVSSSRDDERFHSIPLVLCFSLAQWWTKTTGKPTPPCANATGEMPHVVVLLYTTLGNPPRREGTTVATQQVVSADLDRPLPSGP